MCGHFPYCQQGVWGGGDSYELREPSIQASLKSSPPHQKKKKGSSGNKRPQAPKRLPSRRKLPAGHFCTFRACKVAPTASLASGQGPRPLPQPCIVPPPLALPRKRQKSKGSGMATELHFAATRKTRGLAKPSKKKPAEWQHQSSGASNWAEHTHRGTSMPEVRD